MREIKCYQCEICNEVHRHEKKAKQCEAIGKEEPLANVGDILIYKHSISGFECEDEIKISKIIDRGHYLVYKFMSRLNNGWEKGLYFNDELCGNYEFKKRIKGIDSIETYHNCKNCGKELEHDSEMINGYCYDCINNILEY